MSTQAHTPGPWRADELGGYTKIQSDSGDNIADVGAVVYNTTGAEWSFERAANARLIAAAPDLLAALRKAERLADIASEWNLPEVEIEPDGMVQTLDLRDEFRAAIAKAESQS